MEKPILTGARIERACVALTAAITVIGIQAALAQGADSVTVEVGECVNLQSPEERFACYERQVGAARTAPPASPAPPAAPAAAPQAEAAEPQEFVATVQSLRQTVPNSYVITLDNGQVWRQTYTEWYPLRPGQKVRVRPSRWGGTFWLTADEANGFIQVKRVR
jgi:hypothetical protein